MADASIRAIPQTERTPARSVSWVVLLILLSLGVLIAYGAHLAWQVRRLKADDPARALRLFKSNREAGLILLAGIGLGALV